METKKKELCRLTRWLHEGARVVVKKKTSAIRTFDDGGHRDDNNSVEGAVKKQWSAEHKQSGGGREVF